MNPLKLLVSSALVSIIFSVSQASYSMEEEQTGSLGYGPGSLDQASNNVTMQRILQEEIPLTPSVQNIAADIIQKNKKIFLSYCWEDECSTVPMVDDFENFIKRLGITNYYRGNRKEQSLGVAFSTHIENFMKNSRDSDVVVIFLNDAYLRSRNCMYEFLQIWNAKTQETSPRAIILCHPDFDDLFGGPRAVIPYLEHWKERFKKLRNDLVDPANSQWHHEEEGFVGELYRNMEPIIHFLHHHVQGNYQQERSKGFEGVFKLALTEEGPSQAGEIDVAQSRMLPAKAGEEEKERESSSNESLPSLKVAISYWIENMVNVYQLKQPCFFPALVSSVSEQIRNNPYKLALPSKEIDSLKAWQVTLTLASLTRVPLSSGPFPSLKSLDLQDNKLTLDSLRPLQALRGLEELNLSNNRSLTKEAADLIVSSFPNLTALFVNHIPLGSEGIIVLAADLRNLRTFHAEATHRGDEAITTVTESLTSLTDLNLGRNALSPEGVERLLTSLPGLQSLTIGTKDIDNKGTLPAIMSNLPASLKELGLDHMGLKTAEEIEILKRGLVPGLIYLNLRSNNFGPDSGKGLGEMAARLPNLQALVLSNNNLKDGGIKDLGKRLADHPSLNHLSIDRNNVSLEGIRALFLSLQPLGTLKKLDIQNNAIRKEDEPGYRRLCETFERQKPYLSLLWND